jgi:hypothetical protein
MRLSLSLVGLCGCADWPRFASPVQDSDLVLYASSGGGFAWNRVPEGAGDNDTPLTALRGPLAIDSGYIFDGSLDATGFDPEASPVSLHDPLCEDTGVRTAVPGDYTGDVDSYQFLAKSAGMLCARITWQGDVTVDALLFPVDDCGVPGPAIGGPTLGIGLTGGDATWSTAVEADQRVAVQIAGTTDGSVAVPYHLGVGLVAADGTCPASLPQ